MDLETLDTQPLVDPADLTLDFIEKKENLRPIAIFRVDAEFLLCYDGEVLQSITYMLLTMMLQNGPSSWINEASELAMVGRLTGKVVLRRSVRLQIAYCDMSDVLLYYSLPLSLRYCHRTFFRGDLGCAHLLYQASHPRGKPSVSLFRTTA